MVNLEHVDSLSHSKRLVPIYNPFAKRILKLYLGLSQMKLIVKNESWCLAG